MRFHWLGHVLFEDAANIGIWAEARGHTLTSTKLYAGESLPDVNEIDALAVMGGPMSVYQYRQFPWLIKEKRFIEQVIQAEIPIIGICLGAQLIADILGVKITENPHIEIGWFPIQLTTAAQDSDLFNGLPPEFMVFHWHGDTFEMPPGAERLAKSKACENQAYVYKKTVIGLQFHLEYSEDSIHKMLAHCSHELIEAPFIQNRHDIITGFANVGPTTERLFLLLDNWLH